MKRSARDLLREARAKRAAAAAAAAVPVRDVPPQKAETDPLKKEKEDAAEVLHQEESVAEVVPEQEPAPQELPEGFFDDPEEDKAARQALGTADDEAVDEEEKGKEDDVDRMLRDVAETVEREAGTTAAESNDGEEEEEDEEGDEDEDEDEEEDEKEKEEEARQEAQHAEALGREVAAAVDVRAAWGVGAAAAEEGAGGGGEDEDDSDAAVFGDDDLAWTTRRGCR